MEIDAANKSLPFKSKEKYEHRYSEYCTWKSENNAGSTTENVFLAYLSERSKSINPCTLWSEYSMLKSMISLEENIDVKKMLKVKSFMKQNSKNYTPRKSRTLTEKECLQFLKDAPDDIYLMMKTTLILGIYGACSKCELINLEMDDLQISDDCLVGSIKQTRNALPRTFAIPKLTIDGIDIVGVVKRYISLRPAHTPHNRIFIYYGKGKCTTSPVGINSFAKIPSKIAQFLNLPEAKLYTGHCFRRTSATLLVNAGADLINIQKHGGWRLSTAAEGSIDINKISISKQILRPIKNKNRLPATVTSKVKVETSDEEMEYEAQLPSSSTPSPSFRNILLSPVTIEPKKEEDDCCAENDERISLILNKQFSFLQEQLPLTIATGDYQVMKEIIENDDVFRNATLRTKVHCTVCDRHLGTSPVAQFDRFVHPVLNTLMCESCFLFYNSGEFPKDEEDGSEIYCKWCGQGGTVMCCSDCPFIFCKLCVDRNFGERCWEKIANADTWQCFKCNPSQLSKLQIICCAVHEYTSKIIENAMKTGDKDILEKDISICCKETSTTTKRRKHIVLDDEDDQEDDMPIAALRKRIKVCHDLTESLSTPVVTLADTQSAPPTLERPATSEKQPVIPTVQLKDFKSSATSTAQKVLSLSDALHINPPVQHKILPKISLPASPQSLPLVPVISLPLPSQCKEISQDQAPLKPGMPVITKVEGNVVLPTIPATNASNTSTKNSTLNWALLKHALDKSQEIIDTFTRRCEHMRQALTISTNEAQCAELRNSIQDVLFQYSIMLLETRTILTSSNTNNIKVLARVLPAANKTAVTRADGAAGKHSTIILRNNGTNAFTPAPSGPIVPNQLKRVLRKPPGSRLRPSPRPVTVRTKQNTNSAITTTGLKPVLPMNQIQPANTVRLVNRNEKNKSIVISQVGSKTGGNIVPSATESASKNNMVDKHASGGKKTKTVDRDPLAMSDDESEGICIKTEIETFIDEPVMVKIEVDET